MLYLIFLCYVCGNVLIVQAGQKTKRCTYCDTRLSTSRIRVLARAKSTSEATGTAIHLKNGKNVFQ